MICTLLAVSPAQIASMRVAPPVANAIVTAIEGGQHDLLLSRVSPKQRREFEAAASAMPNGKEHQEAYAAARRKVAGLGPLERPLDLQKSWHILHYLFTGHVEAASAPGDALLTGEPLGDDVGYGPPRLHDAAQSKAFADFLRSLDLIRLEARVDFRTMTALGVYSLPMGVSAEEGDADIRREVRWSFPALQAYVVSAASKTEGLLIWLS